ncbi:MAG: hypothetical protein HC933_11990 [Pleurocapsa sp. SU_196_0]|nr:hypothetical protein [Pleurocapsa sp. SU_196_0]
MTTVYRDNETTEQTPPVLRCTPNPTCCDAARIRCQGTGSDASRASRRLASRGHPERNRHCRGHRSSGIKALAFDTQAQAVPGVMARAAIFISGELDFAALRSVVESVLDDIHAQIRGFQVLALGFGSFASSLVALDANARPFEPSLTYADTRSAAFCESWRADDTLLERTGCPPYTVLLDGAGGVVA